MGWLKIQVKDLGSATDQETTEQRIRFTERPGGWVGEVVLIRCEARTAKHRAQPNAHYKQEL